MSASFTINSCQKICINLQSVSCNFLTYNWGTPTPNIVTVNSSGSSAIIKPKSNIDSGSTTIIVTDISGTIFTIDITINPFIIIPIPNGKYQYIYATEVTATTAPSLITLNFNGPFTSLVAPFQPNFVTFINTINSSIGNQVNNSIFVPGFPNSIIKCNGSFSSSPGGIFNLLLFGRTSNSMYDPILVYADIVTCSFFGTSPDTNYAFYIGNLSILSCLLKNYLSFVQSSSSLPLLNDRVVDSQLFPLNSTFQFVLANPLNPPQKMNVNIILIPKSFYDITSPSLIYSTLFVNLSIPSAIIATFSFVIPFIPVGSVCWFAQQYTIIDKSATVIAINQTSNTSLDISFSGDASFAVIINAVVMAYKKQSNVGFTIT